MMEIEELKEASRGLTHRASEVIAHLGLLSMLAQHGRPEHIGSSSFGLMVKPDIDFGTLCCHLDPEAILGSLLSLASVPGMKEIHLHDERGAFNQTGLPQDEGVYVGLRYIDGGAMDALRWKIDLWFFPKDAPRPEFPLRDRLRQASSEERDAILRIKHHTVNDGTYGRDLQGTDIYAAVLDGGVRSIADWQSVSGQRRNR